MEEKPKEEEQKKRTALGNFYRVTYFSLIAITGFALGKYGSRAYVTADFETGKKNEIKDIRWEIAESEWNIGYLEDRLNNKRYVNPTDTLEIVHADKKNKHIDFYYNGEKVTLKDPDRGLKPVTKKDLYENTIEHHKNMIKYHEEEIVEIKEKEYDPNSEPNKGYEKTMGLFGALILPFMIVLLRDNQRYNNFHENFPEICADKTKQLLGISNKNNGPKA